jgi:uncharacterized protein
MATLGIVLAALIGLSLGVLGGGGSILTVPIFVYVLGFGAKEAIAMSLAVVGATALFGAVGHWKVGNVDLRVALVFGVVAMAGTYLGARLAVYFSGAAQLSLFAVVMLIAAVFMFRGGPGVRAAQVRAEGVAITEMPLGLIVIEGIAVGVLTGLVGVGGGFLIVPALVVLGRLPMKQAVGTSLVVIAMKSAAGFYGYLGQVEVPWAFMTLFTGVAIVGILGGTYLVRFVSQHALQRAFALFLVGMGTMILYQNRNVMVRPASSTPPVATGEATAASGTSRGSVVVGLPNGSIPLEGIAVSGQPSAHELEALGAAGFRTVVDLRAATEPRGFDEAAVVRAAGMEYVSIPVTGEITDSVFDALRQVLNDESRGPTLVHCASANRVAGAMIPYLILDRGMDPERALDLAEGMGLRSREFVAHADRYLNGND